LYFDFNCNINCNYFCKLTKFAIFCYQLVFSVYACLIQQVDQLKELSTELESQVQDMEKLVECKELKLRDL